MPRLFVALDLPEEQRDLLDDLCCDLPDARWTPFDQLHVTLAFIGEVHGSLALDVEEALDDVRAPPLEIVLAGVGHFPPRGEPRVLWAGIQRSEPLLALHRQVMLALERVGCALEHRKFHPHVTLGRLRDAPPGLVAEWLAERAPFAAPPCAITEFLLYSSTLGRHGAAHVVEHAYPLAARTPA